MIAPKPEEFTLDEIDSAIKFVLGRKKMPAEKLKEIKVIMDVVLNKHQSLKLFMQIGRAHGHVKNVIEAEVEPLIAEAEKYIEKERKAKMRGASKKQKIDSNFAKPVLENAPSVRRSGSKRLSSDASLESLIPAKKKRGDSAANRSVNEPLVRKQTPIKTKVMIEPVTTMTHVAKQPAKKRTQIKPNAMIEKANTPLATPLDEPRRLVKKRISIEQSVVTGPSSTLQSETYHSGKKKTSAGPNTTLQPVIALKNEANRSLKIRIPIGQGAVTVSSTPQNERNLSGKKKTPTGRNATLQPVITPKNGANRSGKKRIPIEQGVVNGTLPAPKNETKRLGKEKTPTGRNATIKQIPAGQNASLVSAIKEAKSEVVLLKQIKEILNGRCSNSDQMAAFICQYKPFRRSFEADLAKQGIAPDAVEAAYEMCKNILKF